MSEKDVGMFMCICLSTCLGGQVVCTETEVVPRLEERTTDMIAGTAAALISKRTYVKETLSAAL